MSGNYRTQSSPQHPLAMRNGYVKVHRKTLWDHLHPDHPDPYQTFNHCHWCNWPQYWRANETSKGQASISCINVDHLDGNKTNNNISNLVASCHWCNTQRTNINQHLFQIIASTYSHTPPKNRPQLLWLAMAQPAADGAIHTEEMVH